MFKRIKKEKHILLISTILTILSSVIGITFGIILKSNFVLYDGINNLAGITLSITVLWASGYISKKDVKKFPFGKYRIAPFLVFLQYTVASVLLIMAILTSIRTILSGGETISIDNVFIYTIFTTVFYNTINIILKKIAKNNPTAIVKSEVNQWKIDATTSLAAMISFLVSKILISGTNLKITPYIDSIILGVTSILLLISPIKEIIGAIKELINMNSVSKKTTMLINKLIKNIEEEYQIDKSYVRSLRVGNLLHIEIDFIVREKWNYDSIKYQDEIRGKVSKTLNKIKSDKWITVAFTHEEKYAV